MGKATRTANAFRGTIARAGAGLAVFFGGRALLRGARESVTAFNVQEMAVESLRASLIATGKDGGESLDMLVQNAGDLQRVTQAGDEAIISATASFAQLAPALDAASLRDAQAAIIGIAETFTKGDLESAALLVGKTVGSTTNALTRYGIQVDSAASAQEKMSQILNQSSTFFDVAKARAQTTGGAMQRLSNFIGDVKETIGDLLLSIVGLKGPEGFGGIQSDVESLNTMLQTNRAEIIALGQVFVGVFKVIASVVGNTFQIVGKMLGNLGATIVGIATLDFTLVTTASRAMREDIIQDVGDIVRSFAGFFATLAALGDIAPQIQSQGPAAAAAAADLVDDIKNELTPLESAGVDAGRSLIRGFIDGTDSLAGLLQNVMKRLAEDLIIGTLEKALDISSPSKVAAMIGQQTVAGFIGGVQGAASGVAPAVSSAFALPSGASGGGGGTVTNVTNNYSINAMDASTFMQFARANKGIFAVATAEAARDAGGLKAFA